MEPTEIGINAAYVRHHGDGDFCAAAETAARADTDRGEPKWTAAADVVYLDTDEDEALIAVSEDGVSETYRVRLTDTTLTFG